MDEQPEADPRNHWAFQPIVRPAVPQVHRADWVQNPDRCVRGAATRTTRTHAAGRSVPVDSAAAIVTRPDRPAADRLKRSLHAQTDTTPSWYERSVTRLLDDPRHGERWARHWMDVWRYSDWWGLGDQLRNSQKHIWHWRDWIVESLNADSPTMRWSG